MTRELTVAELSNFTQAKVGDKVYRVDGREETIKYIYSVPTDYPFQSSSREQFNRSGRIWNDDAFPTFFNRPVRIVAADQTREQTK